MGRAEFSTQEMASPRWLTLLVVVAWLTGESAHLECFLAPENTAKTRVSCALMRLTRVWRRRVAAMSGCRVLLAIPPARDAPTATIDCCSTAHVVIARGTMPSNQSIAPSIKPRASQHADCLSTARRARQIVRFVFQAASLLCLSVSAAKTPELMHSSHTY